MCQVEREELSILCNGLFQINFDIITAHVHATNQAYLPLALIRMLGQTDSEEIPALTCVPSITKQYCLMATQIPGDDSPQMTRSNKELLDMIQHAVESRQPGERDCGRRGW